MTKNHFTPGFILIHWEYNRIYALYSLTHIHTHTHTHTHNQTHSKNTHTQIESHPTPKTHICTPKKLHTHKHNRLHLVRKFCKFKKYKTKLLILPFLTFLWNRIFTMQANMLFSTKITYFTLLLKLFRLIFIISPEMIN